MITENEIKRLKFIEKMFNESIVKDTRRRKTDEITLSNKAKDLISTSLTPLSLKIIRELTRVDLAYIILIREAYLYEAIEKYEQQMKKQDREIFKNLRNEIDRLNKLLIDDSELYSEVVKLKQEVNKLEKIKTKLESELKLLKDSKEVRLK